MNYRQTLEYFYEQLPMFHRVGAAAYKADLTKTLAVAAMLGNPEMQLKVIHIAGTNGKGSVSHMLASILFEAGYKTGLYTSPHLKDFRERIRINGTMIPKTFVSQFIKKYKRRLDEIQPSFFEMSFGLCLAYFTEQKTEIAIMETGMGGRLDSTNILHPDLCIITNISLDHTTFLGNSLVAIATEKAGIIKPGIPVVIGETLPETKDVFVKKARSSDAPVFFAEDAFTLSKLPGSSMTSILARVTHKHEGAIFTLTSPLPGDYQILNIRTVLSAVETLTRIGYKMSHKHLLEGILKVKENTGLRGRWELIRKKPRVICDTGHNVAGITEVISQIQSLSYEKLHVVLGMVDDKDINGMLSLFPKEASYYFCKADIPRGMDARRLQSESRYFGMFGEAYATVREAYVAALSCATNRDLIFIGGSTFVVAEIL